MTTDTDILRIVAIQAYLDKGGRWPARETKNEQIRHATTVSDRIAALKALTADRSVA